MFVLNEFSPNSEITAVISCPDCGMVNKMPQFGMVEYALDSPDPVVLVGDGELTSSTLSHLLTPGRKVVAADGGAGRLLNLGRMPDLVIGDMDSLSDADRGRIPADRLVRVADQDTTDFQKCLALVRAPVRLAAGFTGARLDHTLAALNALTGDDAAGCILVGTHDLVVHVPAGLRFQAEPGARVSLFPMAQVSGRSEGLRWPIKGIEFAPDGRVGTSNEATGGTVELEFVKPGMLVILPVGLLDEVIAALMPR